MMHFKPYLILLLLLLTGCGAPATSFDPALAAQQAENERKLYEIMATGTAQAPIDHMTQTAAAFNFSLTQGSVDKTSTAALWTPTNTPVPTITSSPTSNATTTALWNKSREETNQTDLKIQRDKLTNGVRAFIWYFLIIALVVGVAFFAFIEFKRLQFMPAKIHDGTGKVHPYINVLEAVFSDGDKMANGMGQLTEEYVKILPAISAERQMTVTAMALVMDTATRARLPKRLLNEQSTNDSRILPSGTEGLFPLPNWNEISTLKFDKNLIPLGRSETGLEYWDIRNYAHLAIFGRSRAGKSRRSLRPLVAMLLASGQRVVLVGKETDFLPFIGHPNVVFVPVYDVTERDEAMKYFNVLSASVAEKNRRIRLMASNGQSLWQGERTFLVFDEMGNAMLEMANDIGDETLRKARSIANEAGKAGLSLIFSAQRPKGFIDLTTQCGRVVFQVESDQEKGYALGYKGADRLPEVPPGYFYRKFSSVKVLGAFEPNDEQIRTLIGRQVNKVQDDDGWIDGMLVHQPTLPEGSDDVIDSPAEAAREEPMPVGNSMAEWVMSLKERDTKILELYQQGLTEPYDIELAVYKYSNGFTKRRVNSIIERYRELKRVSTTTTTTTPQNMSKLGPVAA